MLRTGVSEPRRTIHYATTKLPCQNPAGTTPDRKTRTRVRPEVVGLTRFELVTPRLSSVCSNQLSYRPSSPGLLRYSPAGPLAAASKSVKERHCPPGQRPVLSKLDRRAKPVNPSCQPELALRRDQYQIDLDWSAFALAGVGVTSLERR